MKDDVKVKSQKVPLQALFEIAEAQEGLFTAKQAESAGYSKKNHGYHIDAGNWVREHRGIFRLAHFPRSEYQQYVLWALWSCNRQEKIEGIYSHETALSFYELSDLNPAKLHMTVPKLFRRGVKTPKILVLHRGDLTCSDYKTVRGFKIVKPLRAIQDLYMENTVQIDFLRQAFNEALQRGLVTTSDLKDKKLPEKFRLVILEWALDKTA